MILVFSASKSRSDLKVDEAKLGAETKLPTTPKASKKVSPSKEKSGILCNPQEVPVVGSSTSDKKNVSNEDPAKPVLNGNNPCPEGWYPPTEDDWDDMKSFVKVEAIAL